MMGEGLDTRMRNVEMAAERVALRIDAHEEVCAERYGNINSSIGSINRTIRWAAVTLLSGMGAILVKLLFFTP